ncbi:MAG TPA: hypothetical protein VG649_11730 [Candidatus Angelobacter sp.]|jgi:hypothetical protein|nr:hypothetical protein [Candidatus Angelobacter sp.]
MAAPNFISGERLAIYRKLFLLNRSFDFILQRLNELNETQLFNQPQMKEMGGLTLELQAEVNFRLLQALYPVEQEEWQLYGRIRNARTRRMQTPVRISRKKPAQK